MSYTSSTECPGDQLGRWDDDVVFRNQARGTENKGKKEFVNVRLYHFRAVSTTLLMRPLGSTPLGLPQTIHGAYRSKWEYLIIARFADMFQSKYVR